MFISLAQGHNGLERRQSGDSSFSSHLNPDARKRLHLRIAQMLWNPQAPLSKTPRLQVEGTVDGSYSIGAHLTDPVMARLKRAKKIPALPLFAEHALHL